jgi:signal transduction histidine kinase
VPQAAAEAAIRAITEALTNVARHARASHVSLHLSTLEKSLQIEICDDGIGFDPEVIQAGHYGLLGMGERVRLAGGSFAVHSIPGDGTRITISLPLEKLPNA